MHLPTSKKHLILETHLEKKCQHKTYLLQIMFGQKKMQITCKYLRNNGIILDEMT